MARRRLALSVLACGFLLLPGSGMAQGDCSSPADLVALGDEYGRPVVVLTGEAAQTALDAINAMPPPSNSVADTVAYFPAMTERGPAVVFALYVEGCQVGYWTLSLPAATQVLDAIEGQ